MAIIAVFFGCTDAAETTPKKQSALNLAKETAEAALKEQSALNLANETNDEAVKRVSAELEREIEGGVGALAKQVGLDGVVNYFKNGKSFVPFEVANGVLAHLWGGVAAAATGAESSFGGWFSVVDKTLQSIVASPIGLNDAIGAIANKG